MTPPGQHLKRRIARTERRERMREEVVRQADCRRARTGGWNTAERIAREALSRNKARLLEK